MSSERLRRKARCGFVAIALIGAAGCKNDEIPLVTFPAGAPAPPSASKVDPNGPQGKNTSQGDPMQYSK